MILMVVWFFNQGQLNLAVSLAVGLVVFVSHWLIDATNLVQKWMHFYGQSDRELVRVMVDQTLHILTLGLLAILPVFSW
jgi:hypothetical protein